MEELLKIIVSGIVAYYVPKFLKWTESKGKSSQGRWVLACFIGGALGGIASGALAMAGTPRIDRQGFGNWAAFGACLGMAQQISLKGRLPVTGWWSVAATAGWAVFPLGGMALGPVLVGLFLGVLQSLTLRDVNGKRWWIGGNIVAWPLVAAVSMALGAPLHQVFGAGWDWVIAWGLAGMLGAVLLIYPLGRLSPSRRECVLKGRPAFGAR